MANTNGWEAPTFKQLQEVGTDLSISFNASKFDYHHNSGAGYIDYAEILSLKAKITKPSGNILDFEYNINNSSFSLHLDEYGEYNIQFILKWHNYEDYDGGRYDNSYYTVKAEGYFSVAPEKSLSPYTIKDVIDRTLSLTPTRTVNGENKYTFRNNAEEYATEESPEFTFTGKHLFEVMLDIASYKKMFPALYKNEIYFRPFWNGESLTSKDLPPPIKAVLNSAIDQYCTALDSYVENMVCINDTNVGTVVEPYKDGYVSARSGGGSEISETTAVIPTQSTIYQPLALTVGEVNGVDVGDIQAYVYEQEDYEAMSDTSAAYPYSKGYALKYTRFSKNYTEMGHRIKKGDTLSDALTYPAFSNIVKAKCGEEVGTNLKTYLSSFIGSNKAAPFADLLFQPTYIPVVNARVRQYKPMISAEDYDATLFYNQQSEVVDSEAFGEHVKGLVQKLGNHTEIRVYRFQRVDDIPTVGTLIDEKSVYDVAMTIYENHVDATICLVDYAELSTYIGVKNEIKTSDISTTKWCNRFVNWEEFLVFTHEDIKGNTLSVTEEALNGITSFTSSSPLTCAMFTSYAEDGASIMTAFAPIKHLALGNSIYFQWEMLDNFAVGYKSEKAPDKATNAWTGTQYDRAQKAVRYCDGLGRMEKLDFQLLKSGPTPDNSEWEIPENEVSMTVDEKNDTLTFTLNKTYECYIIVYYHVIGVDPIKGLRRQTFKSNETSAVIENWVWSEANTKFHRACIYDGSYHNDETEKAKIAALRENYIRRQIAHEYPQTPSALNFAPSSWNSDEEKRPAFQLYDWLIKKNSAEALKFAAQYHFRQTWRDFVIGSGMSNFCSLVGGSCSQLQMFLSASPINRFERHININDANNYLILKELPTFTVDGENMRVEITLPSSINDYIDVTKSWGLVGIDKNGNSQLIFGENKNAKNEAFDTTIYLVPLQKNNEPKSRATYTLTRAHDSTSVACDIYVDGELTHGIEYGSSMEIRRYANVTIYNSYNISSSVNLSISKVKGNEIVSSEEIRIKRGESYTFTLTGDMVFDVWTTGSSGGGNPGDVIIV